MVTKVMKAVTRAVISAVVKAPLASAREMLRKKSDTENRYLVYLAHPDDEILVGGLCSRLMKYSKGSEFAVLTNGAGNTDRNRMSELKKSYELMGYSGTPEYMIDERDIYRLAESERDGVAPEENLCQLAGSVVGGIFDIRDKIAKAGTTRVITNAFEGGHFVHDLVNFMVVRAVAGSRVKVYENFQYSLVPRPEISSEDIHEAINNPILSVSPYATYKLGIPLDSIEGMENKFLGVKNGKLRVGISDFRLKNAIRKIHTSQGGSLNRSSGNITHADFSSENYGAVPLDRNFSKLPDGALPLYEFCDWRPNHLTFKTFRRLTEIVDSEL